MLKFLRNQKNQKKIFIILSVVILPPFLLWGVAVSDKKTVSGALGRVENRSFSIQDYLASYKAIQHQMLLMYGDKLSALQRLINVKGEAWDRLLLLHYAKKERINASDDEVLAWLTAQPLFVRGGRFDTAFYKLFLDRQLHSNPSEFEREVREMLTISKIHERLRERAAVSEEELRSLYLKEHGEREIEYAVLPWESQSGAVTVSDQELQQTYAVAKDTLKTPTHPMSFDEAKEELKKRIVKQKSAEAAVKRLSEIRKNITGDDLKKAAADNGLEVKTELHLKNGAYLTGLGPADPIVTAVSDLKAGQISQALAVPAGAALVRVVKDAPIDEAQFAKDKEEFKKRMLDDNADKKMDALIEELRGKLTLDLEKLKKIFPAEEKP